MDHTRLDQQSRLRDDGDDRHRRPRPVRVHPVARRADAGREPAVRARTDELPRGLARGGRDRRHEAARVRDQHRLGSEPHPFQLAGRAEPGLRRVPHVDRHDEGDAGRARQDRTGAAELPEGRQGAARHPRRPGEPAADRFARRDVADDVAARSLVAHRSDHREGARKRSGRRAHGSPGPGDAADPDPDQAQRSDRARHRRRPGDERGPSGEPGRAGRADHPRQDRFDRPHRGQDQGPGAVLADHRRAAGRSERLPVAGRGRDRRREGRDLDLADQRPPVDHDRHPEIAGREHRRHGPRHHGCPRRAEEAFAGRRGDPRRQLDGRNGGARRQPREIDDRRRRASDGAHRLPLSAQLAQHDHHRAHAADRRDRDVHRLVRLRLHAQLPDADGAVAVHRPPDRRRDRGAREHRSPPGARQEPPRGGSRGHRRDRARRDGDDVRDRRRVRADRLHERPHRALLLPVRRHRGCRRAGVAVRLVHARPDAVRGLARSSRIALQARAVAWPRDGQGRAGHRVAARLLRPDSRMGAGPSQERDRHRPRDIPRELRDRAARRHGVRPAGGRGLHLAATQYARRLEPRIYGQQGAAGRGRAQVVPRHWADDDHGRLERGSQLRARQPEAQGSRASARGRRRRSRARSASS